MGKLNGVVFGFFLALTICFTIALTSGSPRPVWPFFGLFVTCSIMGHTLQEMINGDESDDEDGDEGE